MHNSTVIPLPHVGEGVAFPVGKSLAFVFAAGSQVVVGIPNLNFDERRGEDEGPISVYTFDADSPTLSVALAQGNLPGGEVTAAVLSVAREVAKAISNRKPLSSAFGARYGDWFLARSRFRGLPDGLWINTPDTARCACGDTDMGAPQ